ncbi:hypothetical protein C9374_012406 [Naegleria lovaniensis]|uniref:HMG box domain-containing protein n=1 Tax=Naegleria lovaniensis TaxID=51637 RepID=A0AA88KQV7_NAELO|nr:uncharacterized protein C9374_012406 [Naegleria lovaniensis]KAG2392154.1 hypothetical protein C9374_012406 [Naegleria lovaniensis]
MSLSFICDYFGLTKFQRGKDLESSIYDVMVKLIPEKPNCFKMYSKCTSQQVPQYGQEPIFYRQEVLMKDKKINKAVCTCPDGSQGRCKHICAGILAYISILTSRNQGDEQKLEQKQMILKSGELDSQEHASQMNERTLSQHSVSPHSSSNVLQASNTTLHGDIASSSNEPKKKKKTLPAWMALQSKSEEKESKKKSSKAQSELKKPKTSFFLYCDDHREQVKEELGGKVSASEVAKELGKRWKDLSTEDKQVYIDKQKELQKEYEKQKKGNTMDNSTSEPLTTTRREDNKKKEPLSQQRDENSERVSHNIAMLSEPFMKTTEDSPGKKKPQSLLPKKGPHQVVPNILHTTLCVKKEFQNDNDDDHDDRSACSNIFFSKSGNTEIHPTTSNNNRSEFNPVLRIKSEVSSPVKNSLTNENKFTLPNQFPKAIPSPQQKRDDVEVETTPAVEDDDDDDENISIMDVFFSKKKRKNPPSPRMETARDMGVVSTRGGARHLESVSSTNKDQEDDDSLSTTTTTTTATNTNVFFSKSSKKPKKVHDQQDTTIGTDFTTTTIVQNHSSSPYYQSSSNTTQMVNKLPNNNNATGNDDEEEEEDELTFQQIFFSKSTKTSSSTRQHNVAESKKPMTEKDVETVRSTTNSSGGASSTKSKQTSLKSMMDAFFDF